VQAASWKQLGGVSKREDRPSIRTSWWRDRSESGASLVLALIFIVAISAIVGTMADWAVSDLGNTTHFDNASSLDYAATGATQVAIQSIRYAPLYAQTAEVTSQYPTTDPSSVAAQSEPGYCWTPTGGATTSSLTIDGDSVTVWCWTVQQLSHSTSPGGTRVVTFYTCLSSVSVGSCVTNPLLKAVVDFNDYPQGDSTPLSNTCTSTCGQGATPVEWIWASQS
jgi:hypothetical protein